MIAMVLGARADLELTAEGAAAQRLREAARDWLECTESDWQLSFVAICHHFGVNPDRARTALLGRLRRHQTSADRHATERGRATRVRPRRAA